MSSRWALSAAGLILILAALHVNGAFSRTGEAKVSRDPLATFPMTISGWDGKDVLLTSPVLEKLGVDEYLMRLYRDGGDEIVLYIGYYGNQKEGSVPHSPRHCYPGSGFTPVRNGTVAIPVYYKDARVIRPNLYVFGKGQEREVVVYWYQSRGRVIADEIIEKTFLVRDSLFRNRSDGGLVRFSMRTSAGMEAEAERKLATFITAAYPFIPRVVPD